MDPLEKIERYVRGNMSSEEILAFEKEMLSNSELKEQLEFSFIADQMIIGNETWKLKEQMRKDLNKSNRSDKRKLLYLTLFIISILVALLIWKSNNPKESRKNIIKRKEEISSIQSKDVVQTNTSEQPIKPILPRRKSPINVIDSQNKVKTDFDSNFHYKSHLPAVVVPPTKMLEHKTHTHVGHQTTPEVKNKCADFKAKVEYITVPACIEEKSGKVFIKDTSIIGGTPPYHFILDNNISSGGFNYLSSGNYKLSIKDGRGCILLITDSLVISEKICVPNQYVFNPDYDPFWKIPFDRSKNPQTFKIIDQSGQIVFYTAVHEFYPSEWRGEVSKGGDIGIGLHFYNIEYADGSMDKGSITISR